MADEQTVTTEARTSDNAYGSSFFENYQLVDDSGNPISNDPVVPQQQAQANQPAQPGQPVQGQQPQQQPAQAQPTQQPAQQQAAPTSDLFTKKDDKGNVSFDPEAAMQFLQPLAQSQPQPQQVAPVVQQPQIQPPQMQQPQQAAQQAQPPTFEQTVREKLLMAHQIINDLVGKGYTHEQAVQMSQQQIESYLEREFLERRLEGKVTEIEKKLTEKERAISEQRELVELTPKATNNLLSVSQRYAQNMPPDRFRGIMFDPKYGGEFINRMFDAQNPDKVGLTGEPLKNAMNNWFVKFSANEKNLEMLAMVTQAAVQRELMPSIIAHVRGVSQKVTAQNQEAIQRKPNGQFAAGRQAQAGSSTGFPELDRMLNGPAT